MNIVPLWTGHLYGTNTGKLFLRLEGEDDALRGAAHFNDDDRGITVVEVAGSFGDGTLELSGSIPTEPAQVVNVVARLNPHGNLQGGWTTNFGPAGTLVLYPSDVFSPQLSDIATPAQLYTARYAFGPVVLDRKELTAIASEMQKSFPTSKLIVTISTDTEQIFYLDQLDHKHFAARRATMVKLHVQEPDKEGLRECLRGVMASA